ncbi:MAG: DeoR/GlpR family DNA-binding transcription regulator [bacterium]
MQKLSKDRSMFMGERQLKILDLLNQNRSLRVVDLGRILKVSESTIRRDLQELEGRNLLRRTHGGATINIGRTGEVFPPPIDSFPEEKKRIGQAAASLVDDGDKISIENGGTTLQFAKHLSGKRNITVVTNSISIAYEVSKNPSATVILTGGILGENQYLYGPLAELSLSKVYVDKAFIGTYGIAHAEGLTDPSLTAGQTKMALIRNARKVILLTDHSKIGRVHLTFIAPVTAVHTLVTDDGISEDDLVKFRERGLEVIVV